MAYRTNNQDVRDIIDNCPNISMMPFIATANALVNWLEQQDNLQTSPQLNSDLLQEIERWLAAHFYAHKDKQIQQQLTGRASAAYQGQTGQALSSTIYGQTAITLDVTGILAQRSMDAQQGTRRIAGAQWIGPSC